MKDVEVELKFPLLNKDELIEQLNKVAKLEKEEDYQKDVYYIPAHRNFLDKKPVSEWLRLRETKNKFSINYKNWHKKDNPKAVSCDEFETDINNIESIKKILECLDFKEIVIVEKIRTVWKYKDVEIAIDQIKELGNFIELESKGNFMNIEEAKKYLYDVLEELKPQIGEQDFEGYPYLLLKKKSKF